MPRKLRPTNGERCGTYNGYGDHKALGTDPCEPCLEANAAYMKQLRDARPGWYLKQRAYQAAKGRAYVRLAAMHPVIFEWLVRDELKRADRAGQAQEGS